MKKFRIFTTTIAILVFCIVTVLPASADVTADVWVMCQIHEVQTGEFNGTPDARFLLSALDESFTNTWLIVSTDAVKLVSATALTAYSLNRDVNVHIVSYGTGFRVDRLRVMSE